MADSGRRWGATKRCRMSAKQGQSIRAALFTTKRGRSSRSHDERKQKHKMQTKKRAEIRSRKWNSPRMTRNWLDFVRLNSENSIENKGWKCNQTRRNSGGAQMQFGAQRKGPWESVKAPMRLLSPPSCRSVDGDACDGVIRQKGRRMSDFRKRKKIVKKRDGEQKGPLECGNRSLEDGRQAKRSTKDSRSPVEHDFH